MHHYGHQSAEQGPVKSSLGFCKLEDLASNGNWLRNATCNLLSLFTVTLYRAGGILLNPQDAHSKSFLVGRKSEEAQHLLIPRFLGQALNGAELNSKSDCQSVTSSLIKKRCLAVIAMILLSHFLGWKLTLLWAADGSSEVDPVEQCRRGTMWFFEKQVPKALPLLEAGFANQEKATFADLNELGICAQTLGFLRNEAGNPTGALEAYEVALNIFQNTANRKFEGITWNSIGQAYLNQTHYGKALEAFQKALKISRKISYREWEGVALYGIGEVYKEQGLFGMALKNLGHSLEIAQAERDYRSEGKTLIRIGEIYRYQGRNDIALETLQRAQKITHTVGDQGSERTAIENIGIIYQAQGNYGEALTAYQQGIKMDGVLRNRRSQATTLTLIGLLYMDQKHYGKALEAFQQALKISRKEGYRRGEGVALGWIGWIYIAKLNYGEALKTFEQGLAIVREVGDRLSEGSALYAIGLTYEEQGKPDRALVYYEKAMKVLESIRAVAGSESGRASFIAKYAEVYGHAVALYYQQGQSEKSFFTSERARARAFLDSLVTGKIQFHDNEDAILFAREQQKYAAKQAAQDELVRVRTLDPPDPKLMAKLETQLVAAQKEYKATLDAIAARSDQLNALVPGRSAVHDLKYVKALLDKKTTLVSYYVLQHWKFATGTLAFIITQDSFSVVPLPKATPETLYRILAWLYQDQWPNQNDPFLPELKDLYDELVAPLRAHLRTPQVAVIPHQLLHYVPFAALTDGKTYFGEQYTLFVLPSASALPYIQANAVKTRTAANRTALVFGNPITDVKLKPLIYAAAEAKAVADFLGVKPYTRADATEDHLRSNVSNARVVHLAVHGIYNANNPLYSALFLAPGSQQNQHDGQLEVHEIYELDMKTTDMVVLSACESNIGNLSNGDELVGLTRAFFFVGTPTVVASLWSVDDEPTKDLMVAFYRYWREKSLSKAAALQKAQADVRKNYPSPFYWAAFVLNGDPG